MPSPLVLDLSGLGSEGRRQGMWLVEESRTEAGPRSTGCSSGWLEAGRDMVPG